MSELYVTTSLGNFGLAAGFARRCSVKLPAPGPGKIEGLFRSFDELTQEFPIETIRKIFVEAGPGSFTGVRVGVTFARVLSQHLKANIFPLMSLDIVAACAGKDNARRVSPLIETGNGRVYACVFENGQKAGKEQAVELADWLDLLEDEKDSMLFCGLLGREDAAIMKERKFRYKELHTGDVIDGMRAMAEDKDTGSRPYNEVLPFYIGKKEADERWDARLEEEMLKIKEMKDEKKRLAGEIAGLEAEKSEKENKLEDIDRLAASKDKVKKEIDDAMEELSVLNAKRLAYAESIAAQEKRLAAYSENEKNLSASVSSLESELDRRRRNLEKLKELPPEIPEEVELYVQQRDSLKREVEKLKSEKDDYSARLEELSGNRFKEVLERIKKEESVLENISAMRQQKEKEIRDYEEQLRGLRDKIREAQVKAAPPSAEKSEPEDTAGARTKEEEPPAAEETNGTEESAAEEPEEETAEDQDAGEETASGGEEYMKEGITASPAEEEKTPEAEEPSPPPAEEKAPFAEGPAKELVKKYVEGLTCRLRPLRMSDLSEVMKIEEASFERPWRRQMFKEEMSIPVSKLFCLSGRREADKKDSVLGYAIFWIVSEKAHIINMAVEPGMRHRGIGRLLLYEILKKAKAGGCKSAYLEVRMSAKHARELLAKSGFYEKGTRKEYFGYPKEDAIIFERKL